MGQSLLLLAVEEHGSIDSSRMCRSGGCERDGVSREEEEARERNNHGGGATIGWAVGRVSRVGCIFIPHDENNLTTQIHSRHDLKEGII
jgi:hypothetical protein